MKKCVLFFSRGKQGWSETYYTDSTTLQAAFNRAYSMFQIRALLLSAPAAPEAIRVSDTTAQRKTSAAGVGEGTAFPCPVGVYQFPADFPTTAVLANCYNTPAGVFRPLYLRGNPDSLFQEGAADQPDANAWNQQFTGAFRQEMVSGRWFLQYRDRLGADANQVAITLATNNSNSLTSTITLTDGSLNFVAGDFIQLYRLKGAIPNPGAVRVLDVAGAGAVLTVQYSFPNNYRFQAGGIARKLSLNYGVFTEIDIQRFVSKRVGRPFGVSRGRRRSIPR